MTRLVAGEGCEEGGSRREKGRCQEETGRCVSRRSPTVKDGTRECTVGESAPSAARARDGVGRGNERRVDVDTVDAVASGVLGKLRCSRAGYGCDAAPLPVHRRCSLHAPHNQIDDQPAGNAISLGCGGGGERYGSGVLHSACAAAEWGRGLDSKHRKVRGGGVPRRVHWNRGVRAALR